MRDSVTPGWLGFWEMRAAPRGDYRQHKHGNTRHGRYAKGRRTWWQILAASRELPPPGWRAYPSLRRGGGEQGQTPEQ